LIWYCIT